MSTAEEDDLPMRAEDPDEVWYLQGKINNQLMIVQPLRVFLSWLPTGLVADQHELNMCAFGEDRVDALAALADRIVEDYDLVVNSGHKLSPRMQRHREALLQAVSACD